MIARVPVTWRCSQGRCVGADLPPLVDSDGLVGIDCPGCDEVFVAGDVVALLVLGPGADPDRRLLHAAGAAYTARAVVLHRACAGGRS